MSKKQRDSQGRLLTPKQIAIVQALADGLEPKQLRHRRATVWQILQRARNRTGANNTWNLIAICFRQGIIH